MPGPVCSGTGGPLCSGIGGRFAPEYAVVEDIYEKILDKRSSGQKRGGSYPSFVNWHFIFAITLIGVLLLYKF
jgi:hypothetical protein